MSLPTGTGTVKSLDTVFGEVESLARRIKSVSLTAQARANSGGESAENIVSTFNQLGKFRTDLNTLATGVNVAAANAYAQDRYNDPAFDMQAEFNAVIAGINAVLTWVETNADAATILVFDANNGTVTWNTYSAAQLSGYSTELGNLIALID